MLGRTIHLRKIAYIPKTCNSAHGFGLAFAVPHPYLSYISLLNISKQAAHEYETFTASFCKTTESKHGPQQLSQANVTQCSDVAALPSLPACNFCSCSFVLLRSFKIFLECSHFCRLGLDINTPGRSVVFTILWRCDELVLVCVRSKFVTNLSWNYYTATFFKAKSCIVTYSMHMYTLSLSFFVGESMQKALACKHTHTRHES